MTMNPKQKDFLPKKEGHENDPSNTKFPKTITPSSSRQWSSTHRNPRIVRVSRAFGGKDRHSKVCTVRGLRDRRIRLSVPTALQLYDLQDRLGLNQPSKVVDWLIEATKNEIDKLPPLPMLPENFPQFHHHPTIDQSSSASSNTHHQSSLSHFLSSNFPFGKDLGLGYKENHQEPENQEGFGGFAAQLSEHNLFPLTNNIQSSFANLPFNASNFHWDPANLSLSQFGGGFSFTNNQTVNVEQQQSTNILHSNSSQLYFCPSAANTVPSIIPTFPSYMNPSMMDNVHQNPLLPTTLHLINSPMNVNSKSFHSQGHDDNERHDKNERE